MVWVGTDGGGQTKNKIMGRSPALSPVRIVFPRPPMISNTKEWCVKPVLVPPCTGGGSIHPPSITTRTILGFHGKQTLSLLSQYIIKVASVIWVMCICDVQFTIDVLRIFPT
jgi:hypothetical protein